MIDWITAHLVVPHEPIPVGRLMCLEATGEIQWERPRATLVRASHESAVLVSTVSTDRGNALRIDGNPLKFLQGHNLFGSDDFTGLLFGMYERIREFSPDLQLPPLQGYPHTYDIDWRRLDITYMLKLRTDSEVSQYIDSIGARSRSRAQAGIFEQGTLYFQKRSRYWAFKLYAKYPEFKKRLPTHWDAETSINMQLYAMKTLRQELTLRARELDRVPEELHAISPSQLFDRYRGRLVITDNVDVPSDVLATLPRAARATYYDWRHGHNVKAEIPKNTFYRHRRVLLSQLGVDISAPPPAGDVPKVATHVRTLEPKLMVEIPDFAQGTDLYYDPAMHQRQMKLVG